MKTIIIVVVVAVVWFCYNLFRAICEDISEDNEYDAYIIAKNKEGEE